RHQTRAHEPPDGFVQGGEGFTIHGSSVPPQVPPIALRPATLAQLLQAGSSPKGFPAVRSCPWSPPKSRMKWHALVQGVNGILFCNAELCGELAVPAPLYRIKPTTVRNVKPVSSHQRAGQSSPPFRYAEFHSASLVPLSAFV